MSQTGRARTARAADARALFERAFEASPIPQLLLRDGQVWAANAAARASLGRSLDELVGRPASAFVSDLDDRPTLRGCPKPHPVDVAVLGDGEVLVSWATRSGPREVEQRLGAMANRLPLLWFRIDADGIFRDVHIPQGLRSLSPPSAFIGSTVEEALPADLAVTVRRELARSLDSDAPVRFDYPLAYDGEDRWFQAHMIREGEDQVFVYVTDITARKASEEAMRRAAEEARAAALARTRFVATVSHEVRTPINGILGMADLLSDTDLDDEQDSYVAMLQSAGRALLNVINDVLDFSKIEGGHLRLQPTAFSPRDVVEGALALLAERAHGRGLELGSWIAHGVPPTVIGDANRVEQVLLNLLGNAVKFTTSGGVSVRLSVLRETRSGPVLRFEVVDTGIGIAEDVLPRLFAPFEQGDPLTTRRFGGTGLGLAICRRLADLMGGDITVESEVDVGSVFRFDLPVELPTGLHVAPARQDTSGITASGRPLRVVAFAPGARLRAQLDHEIPVTGATLWASGDWEATLARLRSALASDAPPDLVLCQLSLSGEDDAARVDALGTLAHGPTLVAIAAFGRRDQLSVLRDAPFSEILAAPLRQTVLRTLLKDVAAAR